LWHHYSPAFYKTNSQPNICITRIHHEKEKEKNKEKKVQEGFFKNKIQEPKILGSHNILEQEETNPIL
jgi:hypothetical protein